MATGRDIAQFISKETGQDFVDLYDASKEQQMQAEQKKVNVKDSFKSLVERMTASDAKKHNDFYD